MYLPTFELHAIVNFMLVRIQKVVQVNMAMV